MQVAKPAFCAVFCLCHQGRRRYESTKKVQSSAPAGNLLLAHSLLENNATLFHSNTSYSRITPERPSYILGSNRDPPGLLHRRDLCSWHFTSAAVTPTDKGRCGGG